MKRKINYAKYNRNLLIILIAAAVAACIVVAMICLLFGNDEKDITPDNTGKTTEANTSDSDNGKAKEENEKSEDSVEKEEKTKKEEPSKTDSDEDISKVQKGESETNTETADGDWMLILANPWNKLPEDFTVELTYINSSHMVDSRIADDLNNMMNDLAKEGLSAFVCSSYRTNTKQTTLYNNEVASYVANGYSDEEAAIEAAKWVAIPGTSEHQTGLAVDIMSVDHPVLDEGQEDTAEQQWLMANSYKYGFILRYPNNKSDVTGIYYEPWHYRYVGKDAAKEIFERGICFEEYLAA